MVKLNLRLLRNILLDAIDLFYGIMEIWILYYKIFVGVVGLFYLSAYFPSRILNNIWGEIPQESLGMEIKEVTFSKAVMYFILIYVISKIISLMGVSRRAKGFKIPTRHFGNFETKMIYLEHGIAVAVNKKEGRDESK